MRNFDIDEMMARFDREDTKREVRVRNSKAARRGKEKKR